MRIKFPNRFFRLFAVALVLCAWGCGQQGIEEVLDRLPAEQQAILAQMDDYAVRVVFVRVERSDKGREKYKQLVYGPASGDTDPGSSVGLPLSILALEQLHRLQIPGLTMDTRLQVDSVRPPQSALLVYSLSPDGIPTIGSLVAGALRKRDPGAVSRLYEFLGRDHINDGLRSMGFANTRITARPGQSGFSFEDNRYTNPFSFFDSDTLVYFQEAKKATDSISADTRSGTAYIAEEGSKRSRVNSSDTISRNIFSLQDEVKLFRELFLTVDSERTSFPMLKPRDIQYLRQCLLRRCQPSHQSADTSKGKSSAPSPLTSGVCDVASGEGLLIFNNGSFDAATARECMYLADMESGVEFILAAAVWREAKPNNAQGQFELDPRMISFLEELARQVYQFELSRGRNNRELPAHLQKLMNE